MVNPHLSSVQRISLMRVPIDILPEERIQEVTLELAESEGHKKILFLNYNKFRKAMRDPEYLSYVQSSALVIPVSKSLERAARWLKLTPLHRHHPFEFIIRALGILEEKRKTLYLLGEEHKAIQKIASNIRMSFPGINMVGRYSGFYPKDKEAPILLAIQKATPTALLVGPGVPGKDKWAFKQGNELPVRVSFYSDETFRIMSGKSRRPSKKSFKSGTYLLYKTLKNPLRLFKIFSYLWFSILILYYKLKK